MEKGNTLTLTCNATSFDYPLDELDWFKDGLKLTNGRRLHLSKDVSPGVYTPLLSSVEKLLTMVVMIMKMLMMVMMVTGDCDDEGDDDDDDDDYVDLCCCCCC